MKRQEKSDSSIVPNIRRKSNTLRKKIGKGTTVGKEVVQLRLFDSSTELSQESVDLSDADLSASGKIERFKELNINRQELPAMTMEEIANRANLFLAFEQVRANRGSSGPDRRSVNDVGAVINELVPRLQNELLSGNYYPGMIRRVWIPKSGGGQRGLGIPNVIDRIVQQAFLQILNPHYEKIFHDSSHGFRPNRSCHTAIAEAKGYVEEGFTWVVDIDLEKFFDRVHHQRLQSKLEQKIKDRHVIEVIKRMMKAKVVLPDGLITEVTEGVPQGGPLSPLLSNIVLDELDQELSRRGHHFVRYADDRLGRRQTTVISTFAANVLVSA